MTGTVKGTLHKSGTFITEWKINEFFADCQQVGDFYDSPEFAIPYVNGITKWNSKVYPKGDSEDSSDCISVYLCFQNNNKFDVKGEFRTAFVDTTNKVHSSTTNTWDNLSNKVGWSRYIHQSYVKDPENNLLIDNTLIILCEITLYTPVGQVKKRLHSCDEWLNKVENRFGDFEALLESGNFADVAFTVQDKQINVHKAILSCRSPVFKAMFGCDMKENKQNSVDITDIDHDVMKELFRFIYSYRVKNIEKIAADLLIAADKYQITELKVLCEETLYGSVTVENVAKYLKLTDVCDTMGIPTIQLKELLIDFVATHYKDVDKMPELADLNGRMMYQIMQAIAKQS